MGRAVWRSSEPPGDRPGDSHVLLAVNGGIRRRTSHSRRPTRLFGAPGVPRAANTGPRMWVAVRVWVASMARYRLVSRHVKAIRRFTVRTVLPEPLQPLEELVLNLRWSWHPETLDLFESVDPELWQATRHDPMRLLGEVSAERLTALTADRRFLRALGDAVDELREYVTAPRWYQAPVRRPGGHRLLLPGVRHRGGAAAVLRWPRHPRRRSPEDRQRPGRADHRGRVAVPPWVLLPVAVAGWLAAGALPPDRP